MRRPKHTHCYKHRTGVENDYYNFSNREDAIKMMFKAIETATSEQHTIDNIRFSFLFDSHGMSDYEKIAQEGCCGSFDQLVRIKGRKAYVGCNYDH